MFHALVNLRLAKTLEVGHSKTVVETEEMGYFEYEGMVFCHDANEGCNADIVVDDSLGWKISRVNSR